MINGHLTSAGSVPSDDRDLGHVLLTIARAAIAARLDLPRIEEPRDPALLQPAATFVTLQCRGELRGCIGSLEPIRPLGIDVRENALAAAFRDPRFPPLAVHEFEATTVQVSLLSPAERLHVTNEEELVRRLRPGVDGLILEYDGRRATYLPQVWEAIPDPHDFVAALKRKAGWSHGFWNAGVNVFRYAATKWTEREFVSFETQR
jgi:AmmeMemoRadiSam system protein A